MKLKKYSSALLAALLIAAVLTPFKAVALTGTACPKVGNTKTIGGVKYFCVKSGKKLVWNKGTVVKTTPTPSKSSTVSQSPSATASASPSKSSTVSQSPSATASASPSKSASPSATANSGLIKLTLDEVKKHDSGTSCWSIVFDNVFDLTKWITKHPGGAEKIRAICGKDGTSSFQRQHEGDSGAARELSSFFLGKLGESIKL